MQYDPIKKSLGRFFNGPVFMRKILYFLLDLLLLRTWHVKKAIRLISKKMPLQASVLDAGAGFGQYTWRMSRMNRHWRISAVDIDSEHIRECSAFFKAAGLAHRVNFAEGDLTALKDEQVYDMILSVDVMEHIRDDELVFSNFSRALRPQGKLLISTPSDIGGSDVHDGEGHSFIDEHVRTGYGIAEITGKLEKAGFCSVKAYYTYGVPGHVSWVLSMKIPIMMLNRSKLFFLLLPFYYMITFPFSLILNIFDVLIPHRSGTGLLVSATRK